MDKDKNNQFFYITKAYDWSNAVIIQGNRVCRHVDMPLNGDNFDDDRCKRMMEEHFFVIALGKSIDYLNYIKERSQISKELLDELYEKVGKTEITELRNMREHDDEYIRGDGHKQQNFITVSKDNFFASDATSTLIINGEILLGGKVNVGKTVNIFEKYFESFRIEYQKIIRSL